MAAPITVEGRGLEQGGTLSEVDCPMPAVLLVNLVTQLKTRVRPGRRAALHIRTASEFSWISDAS
jgi:hypothetical protein